MKKIKTTGLWLVQFNDTNFSTVIRVVEGTYTNQSQLLTLRNLSHPDEGVVPLWVTEKHLKNVFRKINDPLEQKTLKKRFAEKK